MRDWDNLYKIEKDPFGAEPSLLIKKYVDLFPKGQSVLDLGCGSGRNALFVARQGFKVTCVDISAEAIKTLVSKAEELGINDNIKAVTQNIAEFGDYGKYGAIICYTTLHFLPDADARRVIDNIKEHTIGKGLNIIADFAGNGPLKKNNSSFWLKEGELKSLYSDWKELFYKEELSRTKATDEQGNHYMQNMAILVSQNPIEHIQFYSVKR